MFCQCISQPVKDPLRSLITNIMDLDKIKDALESSLSLLNEEYESVVLEELKEEYLSVIHKIENALSSLERNE